LTLYKHIIVYYLLMLRIFNSTWRHRFERYVDNTSRSLWKCCFSKSHSCRPHAARA